MLVTAERILAGPLAAFDHINWIGTVPEPSASGTSWKTRLRLPFDFIDRQIADLALTGLRVPAEQVLVVRRIHVLDRGVRARLVQLVVEGRHDVLPRGVGERDDPVVTLGVDADGVVDLGPVGEVDGAVVSAEAVLGVGGVVRVELHHARTPGMLLLLPRGGAEAGGEVVREHDPGRQHDVDDALRGVGRSEHSLAVQLGRERLGDILVDGRRDRTSWTAEGSIVDVIGPG